MAWINMEMGDEEKLDMMMPMPMDTPDFPCGLRLSFNAGSIDKLGLEELPTRGDLLDMRCMMEVTHVSDGPAGKCFEAQITLIKSPVENEDTEPEMNDEKPPKRRKSLYGRD